MLKNKCDIIKHQVDEMHCNAKDGLADLCHFERKSSRLFGRFMSTQCSHKWRCEINARVISRQIQVSYNAREAKANYKNGPHATASHFQYRRDITIISLSALATFHIGLWLPRQKYVIITLLSVMKTSLIAHFDFSHECHAVIEARSLLIAFRHHLSRTHFTNIEPQLPSSPF